MSEDDFIHPSHGHEYILKGSQVETCLSFQSYETVSSSSNSKINFNSDTKSSNEDKNPIAITRSADLNEYKVYKTTAELARKSTNVSTQTEEKPRRVKASSDHNEEEEGCGNVVELSREEVSPPASNSSAGTGDGSADIRDQTAVNDRPSGRMKASEVLMQLVACGSRKIMDGESVISKD